MEESHDGSGVIQRGTFGRLTSTAQLLITKFSRSIFAKTLLIAGLLTMSIVITKYSDRFLTDRGWLSYKPSMEKNQEACSAALKYFEHRDVARLFQDIRQHVPIRNLAYLRLAKGENGVLELRRIHPWGMVPWPYDLKRRMPMMGEVIGLGTATKIENGSLILSKECQPTNTDQLSKEIFQGLFLGIEHHEQFSVIRLEPFPDKRIISTVRVRDENDFIIEIGTVAS